MRPTVAGHLVVIAVLTAITDLATITLAYDASRPLVDIARGTTLAELPITPVLWATIPVWILVFFALGLYKPKRVIGPSVPIPRLIVGVMAGIVFLILFAFIWAIQLSRAWIIVLSVIAIGFVLLGRLAVLGLAQLFNPSPGQ